MRKLFSIVMLLVLGMPFASAVLALAPKSEANVPICCRRGGEHHCSMGTQTSGFAVVSSRCPYGAQATPGVRTGELAGMGPAGVMIAAPQGDAGLVAKMSARAGRDVAGSNRQRGPPVV